MRTDATMTKEEFKQRFPKEPEVVRLVTWRGSRYIYFSEELKYTPNGTIDWSVPSCPLVKGAFRDIPDGKIEHYKLYR